MEVLDYSLSLTHLLKRTKLTTQISFPLPSEHHGCKCHGYMVCNNTKCNDQINKWLLCPSSNCIEYYNNIHLLCHI